MQREARPPLLNCSPLPGFRLLIGLGQLDGDEGKHVREELQDLW